MDRSRSRPERLVKPARNTSPLSQRRIGTILHAAGIDVELAHRSLAAQKSAFEALLRRNEAQAQALGPTGTPGFVVGTTLYRGSMSAARLREAVALARSKEVAGISGG